jgi:hypothetical protein
LLFHKAGDLSTIRFVSKSLPEKISAENMNILFSRASYPITILTGTVKKPMKSTERMKAGLQVEGSRAGEGL